MSSFEVPLLPIRKRVLFPRVSSRVIVGRRTTVPLAENLYNLSEGSFQKNQQIFVSTVVPEELSSKETGSDVNDVYLGYEDNQPLRVFRRGVLARVTQVTKSRAQVSSEGPLYTMVVEGLCRADLIDVTAREPFFKGRVSRIQLVRGNSEEEAELGKVLKSELLDVLRNTKQKGGIVLTRELREKIDSVSDDYFADVLMSSIGTVRVEEKQAVLEMNTVKGTLEKTLELVLNVKEDVKIEKDISKKVKTNIKTTQREYVLQQKMKAIKEELKGLRKGSDDSGDEEDEIEALELKIKCLEVADETMKVFLNELKRLKSLQPAQPDYHVIRNYLDLVVQLPWNTSTEDSLDIEKARKQLDFDHFGLDKVKKRVIEFLAVRKLLTEKSEREKLEAGKSEDEKETPGFGPIICLAGPPGVGKTSLGKSIASSLGRKFVRMSLGGVRDEAEIRGHRKTYVGAMPGMVIEQLKRAKTNNPVILLDEIDKLTSDARLGDPSSALLEVLDPEQNKTFTDHFLNVPFDLSNVMFIATANDLGNISRPLLDRMEIIEIPSYTVAEKAEIARRYLLKKQAQRHGLSRDVNLTEDALDRIITQYTREAGVRNLERQIASLCRYLAVKSSSSSDFDEIFQAIKYDDIPNILGTPVFGSERMRDPKTVGVSTGLAWTSVGGEVLFVEVSLHGGTGAILLTGKLGDVMKESVRTALTFVRSNLVNLGLTDLFVQFGLPRHLIQTYLGKLDVHVHFPAGATPKDGPSAGVAILAALISALSGKPVRADVACTGEISLVGNVLPVGGIKEKVIAAHRHGIKNIVLPDQNKKDVADIPALVRNDLSISHVSHVLEAMDILFQDSKIVETPKWVSETLNSGLKAKNAGTSMDEKEDKDDSSGPILASRL